jgi:hypothetical protein
MDEKLIKRQNASGLILTMMMWGVASVLVTRAYLKLFNYPMLAFGKWHIAHVLLGGIIMLGAMITELAFEGSRVRKTGAIVFGIGWGLFVDETGKYLTKDNNYFFRPAILIIYVSFVIIFLVYRWLERAKVSDVRSQIYWLTEKINDALGGGISGSEKKRMLAAANNLLTKNLDKQELSITSGLKMSIAKLAVEPEEKKMTVGKWLSKLLHQTYNRIFRRKVVVVGLWVYSIYFSAVKIWEIVMIGTSKQKMMMIQRFNVDYNFFGKSDIYMIVFKIIFDLVASGFFLLGARYFWSKKRLRGLRYFQYGLLVTILLSAPLNFYFEQFGALIDVAASLLIYQILLMYRKELMEK